MDPLAFIEGYLSDSENGMKTASPGSSTRRCSRRPSSRQEPPSTNAPMHGRRIGTATRIGLSRPEVPGVPVRDAGLRALCPGGEGSGERNRQILPPGVFNEKDPGDRQSSRDRPGFFSLGFPNSQGHRRPGAGIPPAADRTGYPVPLCGCFILQSPGRSTIRRQSDPGSSRRPGRRLPGGHGSQNHRLRE